MATVRWVGMAGTQAKPGSGFYEQAYYWRGGALPTSDDTAYFAASSTGYSVITRSGATLAALYLGAGATLLMDGSSETSSALLSNYARTSVKNYGTIGLYNASLVSPYAYNFGTIVSSQVVNVNAVGSDSFQNYGSIDVEASSYLIVADRSTNGVMINHAGAVLDATGILSIHSSRFTNQGTIDARGSGAVVFSAVDQTVTQEVTNLKNGKLTGGTWNIHDSGRINFFGASAPLATLAANVSLFGQNTRFEVDVGANDTPFRIASSLTNIASGGALNVLENGDFASTSTGLRIQKGGSMTLGGGTLSQTGAGLVVYAGATFHGYGLITAKTVNLGTIRASNGTLKLSGPVSSTGTLAIGKRGELEIAAAVASTQKIAFDAGSDGTLLIANGRSYAGTVAGYVSGDKLDFAGIATAGAKVSYSENTAKTGGTLTLTNGSEREVLHLDGQFVASGFHLTSDSTGGTAITYGAPNQVASTHIVTAHA